MNAHYDKAIKLKIKKYFQELTTAEKYIAKIIYKNPSILKTKTLDQISRQIHVSRTTLYRLIKKIGFNNVFDLKYWIKEKNLEDISHQPLISDIQETLVNFDSQDGKKFANMLTQASKIFITGRGLSKAIALSLEGKLKKLNFNAEFVSRDDYHIYYHSENPVWIFISISGKSYNQEELKNFYFFDIKKSIMFSALSPSSVNLKNFTYAFHSKTKRDFLNYDFFLPLDLEILCLLVINKFIKMIIPFLLQ